MRACECSRRRVCSRLRSYLRSRKSALNFGSVLRVSNRLLELREQLLRHWARLAVAYLPFVDFADGHDFGSRPREERFLSG